MLQITNWMRAAVFVSLLVSLPAFVTAAPTINPAKDKDFLGSDENVLFWTPEQQVAGYRNWNKIFYTREIPAGDYILPLPEKLKALDLIEYEFNGSQQTVSRYFTEESVAGLLVIKDGDIVFERYGLGNSEETRWISFSVAKSVTSLLVGAAIKDGYIKSVDEKVTDYLPRLKGSAYDQSTLRNILQMSSGVEWNEDYADPEADINQMPWDALGLYQYLRHKPRVAEPGTRFNYNSAETNLVGTLLRSAIGNNLSTYLSEKIWKPFGMQAAANWEIGSPGGGETSGSSINATLRDYGRIGLFALSKGTLPDGTHVLPDHWIEDSTKASKGYGGYGYLWWLGGDRYFSARGIFGQGIYIYPDKNIVIAINSAQATASSRENIGKQKALMNALANAL